MKYLGRKKKGGIGAHPSSFSPGILSVQDKPPHPFPRMVLAVMFLLLVVVFIWALFGRLDIVAVAQGKLIPTTYVKIVQPSEAGLIREILVREGQKVEKGQILMRMDTTQADADYRSSREELVRAMLNLRRVDSELNSMSFERTEGEPEDLYGDVKLQYESNIQALNSSLSEQESALVRADKELELAKETKNKLKKILPLYRKEEAAYLELAEKKLVSELEAVAKTRIRIEKEEEYQAQELIIARESAAKTQAKKKIIQIRSEYERNLRVERAQIAGKITHLNAETEKQEHRRSLLELKAPQSGTVKDLATHTTGTVTQPGTIVMTLVPTSDELRAEVWLSNQDVGFVRPGHEAKLKLTAFQFQKYGMLKGEVEHVAADSLDSDPGDYAKGKDNGGLMYRTLIELSNQRLNVDNNSYELVPGMQVVAEIKLGDRTVMEYLLSPVRKAFHDAGRER